MCDCIEDRHQPLEEIEEIAEDEEYIYSEDEMEQGFDSLEPVVISFEDRFGISLGSMEKRSEEWLAIFVQVRAIYNQLNPTREIELTWEHQHKENFRSVTINIQSLTTKSWFYAFQLFFPVPEGKVYPEVPPRLFPLFSLPAHTFVSLVQHPLLQAHSWSPIRNLSELLREIVDIFDNMIANNSQILSMPPIAGGDFSSWTLDAKKFLNLSPSVIPVEHLITILFEPCINTLAYSRNLLSFSHNQLSPTMTSFDTAAATDKTMNEKSIVFMLAKCHLVDKLEGILHQFSIANEEMVRCAHWIYESPLLEVIKYFLWKTDYSFFKLLIQVELLFRIANLEISSEQATIFHECYEILYLHYDEVIATRGWSCALLDQSSFWREKKIQKTGLHPEFPNSATSTGLMPISTNFQPIIVTSKLEKHHPFGYFMTACHTQMNEIFCSELLNSFQQLPEEATLFVSKENPNYLMACIHIREKTSPYFGATFLFHILIPNDYPVGRPRIALHNHSFGTTRFEPDRYNDEIDFDSDSHCYTYREANLVEILQSLVSYFTFVGSNSQIIPYAANEMHDNGKILGNSIAYGIVSHLTRPFPVPEIRQFIDHYYRQHWSEIEKILLNSIDVYCQLNSSRSIEVILAEMTTIANLLKANN